MAIYSATFSSLLDFKPLGDRLGLPQRLSCQTRTISYLPGSRTGAANHLLPQATSRDITVTPFLSVEPRIALIMLMEV